jgi:hypothetical protein
VLFCRGSWNISYAAVHYFLQGDKVEIDIYNIRMLHFGGRDLTPINLPKIGEEEIEAVVKVMRSGILTSGLGAGPKVTEFEKNYAEFAGVKHAIAVNTGTAALHAAILAAGVKAGDEVILPSFTFVATGRSRRDGRRQTSIRRHRPTNQHP